MADEYTPTTEQIRSDACQLMNEGDFDRWLDAYTAEVCAEAWDEGHRAGWTEAAEEAAEAESLSAGRWEDRAKYGESAWAVPNPYRTPKETPHA